MESEWHEATSFCLVGVFNALKKIAMYCMTVIRYQMAMETYRMQKYSCRKQIRIIAIMKWIKIYPAPEKCFLLLQYVFQSCNNDLNSSTDVTQVYLI